MIPFIIKSAVCLTVLYGFYYLFLRNTNYFVFNRFYLLFSLLFSIIIPLITIRLTVYLPSIFNIYGYSDVTLQGETKIAEPFYYWTFQNALILFYFATSSILFLRFVSNIYKIIKLIRRSSRLVFENSQIVLVEKKTLPYSFFGYIFVNHSEYENGKIEKELIIHEQTHCLQYHSVDIVLIELIQITLWFNPLIMFYRKAIQLNHEFLADKKVLLNHDLNDYQNTLVNLVFRNNSTFLSSNFSYSLTKKRLTMMKMKKPKSNILRILIMVLPLFLFLGLIMSNAQNSAETKSEQVKQNDTIPSPPPPPTKDKQEEKSDAAKGQSSVKDMQIENDNLTPPPPLPPPPPPPPLKKEE